LFVWHTAEESGLRGATYFMEYPTVPRDSIVAQINIDMIGRGRASDILGGSDDYLAVVGSKRLSEELGNMVTGVNEKQQKPLKLDYRFDGDVTWPGYNNIYGRSDHARYAARGIPIAFFFTGLHQDYHRVTDEPQYIDYPHYTRITNYINQLIQEVANRDKRPAVTRPVSE
jgi:Zn-dependent M28 family amino/carboxypeptidase